MSEGIEDKAKRLLASNAVQILFADELHIVARVRGDHGVYDTEWSRFAGRWSCTCAHFGDGCSHVVALSMCTTKPALRLVKAAES